MRLARYWHVATRGEGAEVGADREERTRTQATDDAVRRQRLRAYALIAAHERGRTQDAEQGLAVARRGAVVGVGGVRGVR